MCLILCANSNAEKLLQPTIDRSWRHSLSLCVWHAEAAANNPPDNTAERRVISGDTITTANRRDMNHSRTATRICPSALEIEQVSNCFAEAWARFRRWFSGGE
jgi:hypothetical protein